MPIATYVMNTVDAAVMRSIEATLSDVLPQGGEAFLFGSRARGDARADSDWDVLILLNKTKIEADDYDMVSFPLVELGWSLNQCVSPVLYTCNAWRQCRATPFHQNVNREAIPLCHA